MNYNDILEYIDANSDKPIDVLYNELKKNNNINLINFAFYDLFNYEHLEEYIDPNETYEEKIKRKDKKFKENVKSYYKTCIITHRSECVCEVAHIFPFSESEIEEKYNEYNGILLCRDLHKLFDDKLIKIDPEDYKLIISEVLLNDNTLIDYHKYHNKILNIRNESKKYFEKFYK